MSVDTTLREQLGTFLISRFDGAAPEAIPAITVALANAMADHLALLTQLLQQSGHVDPVRKLAMLSESAEMSDELDLDFMIDGDELVRVSEGGIPIARPASAEEIELFTLVGRLHGDLVWARAAIKPGGGEALANRLRKQETSHD